MDNADLMLATAEAFVAVVSEIPHDAWERPGLGVWDVRALVGHTGRAISTVITYLDRPASVVRCETAAAYLSGLHTMDAAANEEVAGRGVQAGHELGDEPAEVLENLVEGLRRRLAAIDTDPVIDTAFGGMRLSDYLETRLVELVVHCGDIAAATGLEAGLPPQAVQRTLTIVGEAAVLNGRGMAAIRRLTGRDGSDFQL